VFFGDKILHLESNFRKLGSATVLRSLIKLLRARLAQIDTEMAERNTPNWPRYTPNYARLQSYVALYDIGGRNPVPRSGFRTMIRIGLKS